MVQAVTQRLSKHGMTTMAVCQDQRLCAFGLPKSSSQLKKRERAGRPALMQARPPTAWPSLLQSLKDSQAASALTFCLNTQLSQLLNHASAFCDELNWLHGVHCISHPYLTLILPAPAEGEMHSSLLEKEKNRLRLSASIQ